MHMIYIIRKEHIQLLRRIICSVMIILLLLSILGCKEGRNEKTHRLQWWLDSLRWDTDDRKNDLSGNGIVIAVIDTAIDDSHPDLKGKIIDQHLVSGITNPQRFEHGTAIAGIICATPNNKDGVLGIACDAEILSIVIGDSNETSIDSLVEGIEYAISKRVNIINISAGVIDNDSRLEQAIDEANASGIVVVAAAGNNLDGTLLYPAQYSNVLSVNSLDSNNSKLFSDDGKSIYLPGGNIVTTYSSIYEPKKYVSYTGTSTSSAIMTGIIALILQQSADIIPNDIYAYFQDRRSTSFNIPDILSDFNKLFPKS